MQAEPWVEVLDGGSEAIDDTYFPTIAELIPTVREDKSTLGLHLGNRQGKHTNSSLLWIGRLTIYRKPYPSS
jgi:hypothetical protein